MTRLFVGAGRAAGVRPQDLVGASYLVDGALQSIKASQVPQAEQLLVGASESVRGSIHSLRSVMVEVYPRTLHDRGLRAALSHQRHARHRPGAA